MLSANVQNRTDSFGCSSMLKGIPISLNVSTLSEIQGVPSGERLRVTFLA